MTNMTILDKLKQHISDVGQSGSIRCTLTFPARSIMEDR
jgi:hypothetical protein